MAEGPCTAMYTPRLSVRLVRPLDFGGVETVPGKGSLRGPEAALLHP